MKSNDLLCDYCSEAIESSDTLTLCKSMGIHFRKYHTTCYGKAAAEDRIRLSKPINFSASVLSLSILNLAILAFIIFLNEKRLIFAGILLASIVFIDIPYYLQWKNVVKPLHDRAIDEAHE